METKNSPSSSSSSSSSSSFTADLFGTKEQPSSAGIFASIFPPPSTVVGRNSLNSGFIGTMQKQQPPLNQGWTTKQGNMAKNIDGESNGIFEKERSSIFQDRAEPCPLSSSLYYGGQEDMYIKSSGSQTTGSYPIFKKNGGDDDSNSASRGNWWQGSLYY